MAGIPARAAAGGCDDAAWQRSRRLLGAFHTPRGRPGRVSRFFRAPRCPRFNRRTPARGKGAGGLECTWRPQCAVLESQAGTQKRGQTSPDDGDALALTFSQPVAAAEVEEPNEEEEFGRYRGSGSSGWMR
jgi:hypothetical protein